MTPRFELTEGTQRRIEALFPPPSVGPAAELLLEFCGGEVPFSNTLGAAGVERVRFAALKVCQGRLDLLCQACDMANTDWRDLLVAAGFANDPEAHLHWMPELRPDGVERDE